MGWLLRLGLHHPVQQVYICFAFRAIGEWMGRSGGHNINGYWKASFIFMGNTLRTTTPGLLLIPAKRLWFIIIFMRLRWQSDSDLDFFSQCAHESPWVREYQRGHGPGDLWQRHRPHPSHTPGAKPTLGTVRAALWVKCQIPNFRRGPYPRTLRQAVYTRPQSYGTREGFLSDQISLWLPEFSQTSCSQSGCSLLGKTKRPLTGEDRREKSNKWSKVAITITSCDSTKMI